jgi:hypothetical protein
MKVWVADALVLVVKMATVLEKCNTEEQRSLVRFFCVLKDSMQRTFKNKCSLLTVGSVRRVKRFTVGSRNSLNDVRSSQMMPDQVRK